MATTLFPPKSTLKALYFIISLFELTVQQDAPKILLVSKDSTWQLVSDIPNISYPVYFGSEKSETLHLRCQSSLPITWNLTGFINPPEVVNIDPPLRDDPDIFKMDITFHFSLAKEYPDFGSSLRVICKHVEDPTQKDEVLVFGYRNNSSPFVSLEDSTVQDSKVIPCPTMNPLPSAAPSLYQIRTIDEYAQEVEITSVTYDPTEGFYSNGEMFKGSYICKHDPYSITITAIVSGEYTVIPTTDRVLAFLGDTIQLECLSRSKRPVKIVVNITTQQDNDIIVSDTCVRDHAIVKIWSTQQEGVIGNAQCLSETGGLSPSSAYLVKEWEFEFIRAPDLDLDNAFQRMDCFFDASSKLIQTVSCKNSIECNYMSRCLKNVADCNFDGQKQFSSNASVTCFRNSIESNCTTIRFSHINGIVQCTGDGLGKKWEYFESLRSVKYFDWQTAPTKELVQMEEERKDDNGNASFFCEAVAFLFAYYLSFEIEFYNGTKNFLENDGITVNISNPLHHARKIEGVNVVATLQLLIPSETAALYCHAYWLNATDSMVSTIKFHTNDNVTQEHSRLAFYIATPTLIIFTVLIILLALLYRYKKKYGESQDFLQSCTDNEIEEFLEGRPELISNVSYTNVDVLEFLPYNTDYEIPLKDLKFDTSKDSYLGKGNFSYVVRGQVISKALPVAIKMATAFADVTMFKSILSEVKIMIYIGQHENVISLVGVCTESIRNRSIYIVTDICELGALHHFLREGRSNFMSLLNKNQELDWTLIGLANVAQKSSGTITTLDLIVFALQIANGMEYLSSKSIIHADLAARNILLTKNKVVKISDFGLSKNLYESKYYVKSSRTPVPWRWMAVEALSALTFSTASDVWAYGVTLYELFTLGDIPFPLEEWSTDFYNRFEGGLRMGRPKHCTLDIYTKMLSCWESEPSCRPSFTTLHSYFEEVSKTYSRSNNLYVNDFSNFGSTSYSNVDANVSQIGLKRGNMQINLLKK